MRLGGPTQQELDEFLCAPLSLWGRLRDQGAFLRLVTESMGRHPLLIAYLGQAIYERLLRNPDQDIHLVAANLLQGEGIQYFREAVEELFFRDDSFAERVPYLQRCREAASAGESISEAVLTDRWVKQTLERFGYSSTYDGRRMLLQGLEMKGLLRSESPGSSRYQIETPLIYQYLTLLDGNIEELIGTLAEDIQYESARLMLGARDRA